MMRILHFQSIIYLFKFSTHVRFTHTDVFHYIKNIIFVNGITLQLHFLVILHKKTYKPVL